MTNQQQNPSVVQMSQAEKSYSFNDLPKDVRDKLLQMQNSDGDFLKKSSGETGRRIVFLILLIITSIGLVAIVADDSADGSLDLKRIVVFSVDAFLLSLWFVYFVCQISKMVGSPLKNLIYLTPTQVVETLDGCVRYRELKDAEIVSQRRLRSSGSDYDLNVEFADGDLYRFWFGNLKKNVQNGKDWQEKALNWQQEAISAFQHGDTAYFESHDVFSKISETKMPVVERQFRIRKENLLFVITIMLIALNGTFVFFIIK